MALQAVNDPMKCRDNEGAVVELIYVPGFTTCRESKYEATEDSKPFQDRLIEAFPDTRILVYGYSPDITKCCSAGTVDSEMISNAAVLLLSECRRTETNRREPRSLVFACSGLGGLIVKKALILAEALEPMTSTARRTCGIVFVGTPHAGDVESWADKFPEGCSPDRDHKEPVSMLKACADVSSAFDKISPFYTNVHFCEEKWLECSNASLLHGECLWANIPQSHMIDSTTQHYLIPDSISEVALQTSVKAFLSYVIGAAMRRYESCHTSLKYQKALRARYIEERLPDTCTWLLRHEKYRRWLDPNGPACLWIYGVAGTGKSILSSTIVDDLLRREHSMSVTVSCFLDENFTWNTSTRSILQTLISQLESHDQIKTMTPRVRYILNDIETSTLPMPTTVFQHYLRIILADIRTNGHILLVFDGVDSDGKMGDLIARQVVVANTARCKSGFIRCSFSSRTPYNGTLIHHHVAEINLGREAGIERDLMSFARHRLTKLRRNGCKEVSSLAPAQQLCSRAEGVFLWIALATEDLCRSQLIPNIFTSINSLPLGINGLYHKALEGIAHRHIDVAIKVFSWLLASHRPIKLSELGEALRIQSESNHEPTERDLCMQQLDGDLPDLCNSLVSITEDNVVRFAHPSIRGYFSSTRARTQPWNSVLNAHELLAKTCLTVLDSGYVERQNLLGTFSQRAPGDSASALVNYAAWSWAFHYGIAEPCSRLLPATLQRSLSITLDLACEKLCLSSHGRSIKIMQTILRICSMYGFSAMVQMYLEMGVSPDCESCPFCAPPVYLAAAGGHHETVALLLQKGADVHTRNYLKRRTPPLPLAKLKLVDDIEEFQQDALSSVSRACWSNLGMTPIHVASHSGHLEVTKLLVSYGADVNATLSATHETPLHLASARGHFNVVKYLVDEWDIAAKAVDVYDYIVRQSYYQTWSDEVCSDRCKNGPFVWEYDARCSAEQDIERLLAWSSKYADINARDCHGRTPLHHAVQNGHEAVTRLLVEVGASHEALDNYGFTALQLAVKNGHLAIVRLLVMAGVRINLGANRWGAALEQAAEKGHDPIANLIIWQTFQKEISSAPTQWPQLLLPFQGKENVIQSVLGRRRDQSEKTRKGTSTRLSIRSRNS